MKQILEKFLKNHLQPDSHLLLAYSGGPDSTALLHLLLACRERFSFTLHLAHVDHGWRPESAQEAKKLHDEASSLGLPLHVYHLEPEPNSSNLEDKARRSRYEFFQKLYHEGGFQALLLGHQQDDLAETALKRVLEGVPLYHFGAMRPVSTFERMTLFRPLLCVSKKQLLAYLNQEKIAFLQDPTNQDTHFLRARMRSQLLPTLSEQFGKQISKNLALLASASNDLEEYLSKKIKPLQAHFQRGPFGAHIDLTPFFPLEKLEIEAFLRSLFATSREIFSEMTQALLTDEANRKWQLKKQLVIIDRSHLFLLPQLPATFKPKTRSICNRLIEIL